MRMASSSSEFLLGNYNPLCNLCVLVKLNPTMFKHYLLDFGCLHGEPAGPDIPMNTGYPSSLLSSPDV